MLEPTPRLQPLDTLRALAILLVLGRHLPERVPLLLRPWSRAGWVGVDLFFVLSGFLVAGLLFSEYRKRGSVRVGRFFVRRAFKIYPAFFFFLAIVTCAELAAPWLDISVSVRGLVGEALFLQNYVGGVASHTWSLAVEEHFYILAGLSIFALARRRPGSADPFPLVVPATVAVAVSALAMRVVNVLRSDYAHATHLYPTHLRVDSLLFGVMLAYLHHFRREALREWVVRHTGRLVVAAGLLVCPAVLFKVEHPFMHTFGLTMLFVGFGGVVLLAVHSPPVTSLLSVRALARVGTFSYSIYLWHIVARDVAAAMLSGWAVVACAYTAGAVALGVVMAKLVEVPALRVRDRLFSPADRAGIESHASRFPDRPRHAVRGHERAADAGPVAEVGDARR